MNNNIYWRFLKLFLTAFIIILVPTYLHYYGAQNFLWISDVGLFLTVAALWMNSTLLMSMAAVGGMLVELAWVVDFFGELILGINVITLADYMFNPAYPLTLRAISLFHVGTPVIWILYLRSYGYDRRGVYYFTGLYWVMLFLTYLFTTPKENINWVFLPQAYGMHEITPLAWVIVLFIGFPLCIFLPTHLIYRKIYKEAK
jgi:hypothetical protein